MYHVNVPVAHVALKVELPPAHIEDGLALPAVGGFTVGQLMVVVAVFVLSELVGSVTPVGGVTVATFVIVPLAPAVPITVKVTLPPLGKVGIVSVPACNAATVGLDGQVAPPVAVPQLTLLAVKLATLGSLTVALFAALGPALLTTNV